MGETGHPDYIRVQAKRRRLIFAEKADLQLRIQGKSLLSSAAAYKKAHEVVQLCSALEPFGIREENLFLDGVETDAEKRVIGQITTVQYRIRIRCTDLPKLKEVLGVIASQQDTKLERVKWGFENNEEIGNQLLETCVRDSKQEAEWIASALGVTLIGVYSIVS